MESVLPSEDQVRLRAYELWEADGCPPGQPDEYWHRARTEFAVSDAASDSVAEDSLPASDPPSTSGTTVPR
jgi:hypothetical protein